MTKEPVVRHTLLATWHHNVSISYDEVFAENSSKIEQLQLEEISIMITKLLITTLFGFLSCVAVASDDPVNNGFSSIANGDLLMADNPRKDRRDNRQEDRQENRDGKQDCRQKEGRVGHDKRECKQDERGKGDKDKGAEADESAAA